MSRYYDQIRKEIAKSTGLTGVEAGHILNSIEKKGGDPTAYDWKTIGENMYGHGHRTGGLKSVVRGMYGTSIGEVETGGAKEYLEINVHSRQGSRSPTAQRIDNMLNAKKRFKITNDKGVSKWLRSPNKYDIEGVDDKY